MNRAAWPLLLAAVALAQDPILIGPGVTPPQLLRRVEPEFTDAARDAGAQGTVLFGVVVGTDGRLHGIQVLSPLGYGLEDAARRALERWSFKPATLNGNKVAVLAEVEVNFRFLDAPAPRWERERTDLASALSLLEKGTPGQREAAVKRIEKLAGKKYVPAYYALSRIHREGLGVPRDEKLGEEYLQKAAAGRFGQALYETGKRELATNPEAAFKKLNDAAELGSITAQHTLGHKYSVGDGVPPDPKAARRYFQLCAAANNAICQLRLGRLILEAPDSKDRDKVEAAAWLHLAAEQNLAEARAALDAAILSEEQKKAAAGLAQRLLRP